MKVYVLNKSIITIAITDSLEKAQEIVPEIKIWDVKRTMELNGWQKGVGKWYWSAVKNDMFDHDISIEEWTVQ